MSIAFLVGDRVGWPSYDGWHYGTVLSRRPFCVEEGPDGSETMTLRLTMRDEANGRIVERNIRSVCALIPGQLIERAANAVRVA